MKHPTKTITTIIALLALTSCTKTIYQTTPTTTTPKTTTTTKAPTQTNPPSLNPPPGYQEVPNDYNPEAFDTFLWENVNDFWWQFTTEQLLQMGLSICATFDQGYTIDQVTQQMITIMNNTNTTQYMEGLAALTASALTYLCPEHQYWLQTL